MARDDDGWFAFSVAFFTSWRNDACADRDFDRVRLLVGPWLGKALDYFGYEAGLGERFRRLYETWEREARSPRGAVHTTMRRTAMERTEITAAVELAQEVNELSKEERWTEKSETN